MSIYEDPHSGINIKHSSISTEGTALRLSAREGCLQRLSSFFSISLKDCQQTFSQSGPCSPRMTPSIHPLSNQCLFSQSAHSFSLHSASSFLCSFCLFIPLQLRAVTHYCHKASSSIQTEWTSFSKLVRCSFPKLLPRSQVTNRSTSWHCSALPLMYFKHQWQDSHNCNCYPLSSWTSTSKQAKETTFSKKAR